MGVGAGQAGLSLTETAREAARRDLAPGEFLRIAFAGGCGAVGFRLSSVRRPMEGDVALSVDGVPILLDAMAAQELGNATLDYGEEHGFELQHARWGVAC